jgi:hypothetical protein
MIGLAKKTAQPRETKLGRALRNLGKKLEATGDVRASRAQMAAAALDKTAFSVGARGARVKTLGAYYQALEVYRQLAGQPYEE